MHGSGFDSRHPMYNYITESPRDLPIHGGPQENCLNRGRAAKTVAMGCLKRVGLAPCAKERVCFPG